MTTQFTTLSVSDRESVRYEALQRVFWSHSPYDSLHTFALVEIPLPIRFKKNHGYDAAFWVYMDGWTQYMYTHRSTEWDCTQPRFLDPSLLVSKDEDALVVLAAAHVLLAQNADRFLPWPCKVQRLVETVHEDIMYIVPGKLPLPYRVTLTRWNVVLGECTCIIERSRYQHEDVWYKGLCYEGKKDYWCYQ